MNQAPIEHWSYSSLMTFLADRFAFYDQYVLKNYDNTTGPAAVVGSAAHKALECYYRSPKPSVNAAVLEGQRYIDGVNDAIINYGKTGSREKIVKDYIAAINLYFAEAPQVGEVLGVEDSFTTMIHRDEIELPIPIKVKTDLTTRLNGKIVIRDHKFVSSYTDPEIEDPERILQSMFYYFGVLYRYGEAPEKMVFDELKYTKNSDGSPQRQPYEIIYAKHPEYLTIFHTLYEQCTTEICKPDCQYLPNFRSMFTGQKSFDTWRAQLLSSDLKALPVVRHRPTYQGIEILEAKKYVPSLTDGVDSATLTEEEKIKAKLLEFGLAVDMKQTYRGLHITKFTMKPSRGIRMSQFEKVSKDLAIALQAASVRVEAPIMGTDLIGIEIPAQERKYVALNESHYSPSSLTIPIGVDVFGQVIKKDLSDMPHLLVAGTTGSGKSVLLNVIIKTLVEQNTPEELRLVLIDPKRVELAGFQGLPHLEMDPITEASQATSVFWSLVENMEERYSILQAARCRNIDEYNTSHAEKLPKMVVVVDEMADLMLQKTEAGDTVEIAVIRLAQKARAAGIHLILGTQRPSVDVVTGLLKANMPTRIAFRTASEVDSRVILDTEGAEELLGKGDLLFLDPGTRGLQRLQSLYV